MKKATTKLSAALAVLAAGAVAAPGANAASSGPMSEVVSGHGYGFASVPAAYSGPASEVVSGNGYGLRSVPAASSRPVSEVVSGHGYGFPNAPSNAAPAASTSSGGGFDWGDAGIGAAAVISLLGLAGGAILVVRRGRSHETAIS